MTTTELINLLKKNEFGSSGRPREISLGICPLDVNLDGADLNDETERINIALYGNHEFKVTGGGDGVGGAQLDLDIVRCSD
jgi:hypothetical protein